MHEMVTLMNPPECEHMIFQNMDIISSFHSYIFRKVVQTWAAHISTKSTPHHYTAGCFTVLTVNFGSNRDAVLGRRTIFGTPLTSLKVLSLLNITFLYSAAVQYQYFLQKPILFFFIAVVSSSFLAARRQDLFEDYVKLSWSKRSGGAQSTCFFNSTADINGYDNTSCFKSLSVLGEVFFRAPETDFRFSTIPGNNDAAHLFY